MRKGKITRPTNPRDGQLYYDYPTKTMRVWNGRRWQETNPDEINSMIAHHGSLAKWMKAQQQEGKLPL